MTNSFEEFSKAKMFLVIGSNMTEAHPVASTFLKNAVQKGAKLIVVDPRAHRLVDFADLSFLLRPFALLHDLRKYPVVVAVYNVCLAILAFSGNAYLDWCAAVWTFAIEYSIFGLGFEV